MSTYLPEVEEIYFAKTKEYFQEVMSSYSIGNYRSATVMLYSVAICDLLFKLQELKDMYNDTVANEILKEVDKSRNEHDNKAKSKWEKELVDNIYKKTELLDLEAYTNLNHLYDHRNFSAHPALNENYELVAPSKETTIANIKNILKDILVKPPIFIKNIVNTLTEDLKSKNDLYENEDRKLAMYLNNKYFSKMSNSMKLVTLKAFWKFCFCLLGDADCQNNLAINRKALEILILGFQQEAIAYIKENNHLFSVANDKSCQMNLAILLSKFPVLYSELDSDTQLQVDAIIDKDTRAKRTTVNNAFFSGFTSPVDIDDEERKFIITVAEQLELGLPDDFFDLGNLSKDSLTSNIMTGPNLKGSPEEIQKYRKIKKLHETISNALDWAPVEKAFSNKLCIRLAIQNCGKAIDEDVEISFVIPKNSLLTLNEFPQFKNSEMGYLLNDCDMSVLFGINSTSEYFEYSESERNRAANYTPRPYGLPGYIPNYSDDFIEELNDVFCYSIYSSGDNYIAKLKVDYIKHNTTVAFPSILFVKDEIIEIPYKITSKNNPDVVEGVLKVQNSNV